MCCFTPVSLPVSLLGRLFGRAPTPAVIRVSSTRIFARMVDDERQALVYTMRLATPAPVAMVLPLPIAEASAVDFVDLSGCADFFDRLENAFPLSELAIGQEKSAGLFRLARPKLAVVKVGDFVASFVPTVKDFDRLDERFRLPQDVWDALPRYADFGFAVFQLGAARDPRGIHPMAFTFRTREPRSLFFPTVHVHDGVVHEKAAFDHSLYGQGATFGEESIQDVERVLDLGKARGLVARGRLRRITMHGVHPNDDQRMNLDPTS